MAEQKLIPFDLERALKGDKVITREGKEVKGLHLFEVNFISPLIGIIDDYLFSWKKNGKYVGNSYSNYDLFMAPKVTRYWMIVSETYKGLETSNVYPSMEKLLKNVIFHSGHNKIVSFDVEE